MLTTVRPVEWNVLHDRALSVLTPAMEPVADLRARLLAAHQMDRTTALVALQDLVAWGFATEHRFPITASGDRPAGERIYFAAASQENN